MEYMDSVFNRCYRCYPVSFIDKVRRHLENGDKIIMPPSALDCLAYLHIDYPILFNLRNPSAEKFTHCGVLEFIADEGRVYLPYWMMENMLLQEGDIVQVRNASLVKGTYVKLQPHTKDFFDISNPKAILETTLRSYSCLTSGDTIMVPYNNKKYFIDIVETKPSSAVSIIETDCEVDFAPPLDYKETEKSAPSVCTRKTPPEVEEEPASKIARFIPFTGSARRLNGKLSTQPSALSTLPVLKQQQANADNGTGDSKSSSSNLHLHSGKLVFGSSANQASKESNHTGKETPKDAQKEINQDLAQNAKEPKCQAFSGKKYSLKS